MRAAAEALAPTVGLSAACRALGVPRASVYRQRNPGVPSPPRPRRPPSHALASREKEQVLDTLHEERFVDRAPAAVYATLLEEGRYLCSIRTMYRVLKAAGEANERRPQRRHPHREPPQLMATSPNQVWTWDITPTRSAEVGDLPPLRRAGSLLALRRGVDGGFPRERHTGQEADPRRLSEARCRARSAYAPPGPWCPNDSQDLFAVSGGSRHPGQLQSASRIRRQPVLGKPLQDRKICTRLPGPLLQTRGRQGLLSSLLPVVQHPASSQQAGTADTRTHALRSSREPSVRAARGSGPSLYKTPRSLHQRPAPSTQDPNGGLDQSAQQHHTTLEGLCQST